MTSASVLSRAYLARSLRQSLTPSNPPICIAGFDDKPLLSPVLEKAHRGGKTIRAWRYGDMPEGTRIWKKGQRIAFVALLMVVALFLLSILLRFPRMIHPRSESWRSGGKAHKPRTANAHKSSARPIVSKPDWVWGKGDEMPQLWPREP